MRLKDHNLCPWLYVAAQSFASLVAKYSTHICRRYINNKLSRSSFDPSLLHWESYVNNNLSLSSTQKQTF